MEKGKKILQKYISISNHIRDIFLDFSKLKKKLVYFSQKITKILKKLHQNTTVSTSKFC